MRPIAYDGEIRINTKIDSSGISSGVSKIKSAFGSIVSSLSVFSLMQQGVDMVTGSIDSALDRGDTMDQFDRTMNKLVGDSTKVDQALDSLKDITTGTAYSLDTAAKATQNFVTRGMDLEDATSQVGIWADAVSFYGKGTSAELETVTDALAKMRTKGTVEMDQLNRLFDVGVDAVGMYAKATGQSSAAVQYALTYGMISSDDFINTVSEAMETGAGGVQKLAGAAKEAGASWSGTIANMHTAVTRGVLGIIESLDEGLQAANLPGIKDIISGIGSTIEDVLGRASGMIPGFIDAAMGIYGELKPVISGLGDVISGVIDTVQQKLPKIISAGKEFYDTVAPDLKDLTAAIGDLLGGAIKTVVDMLPGAIQTATNLYNTIKPLTPLILGVTAAVKGWQAFRSAQSWLGNVGTTLTTVAQKIISFTDESNFLGKALGTAGNSATNASKLFTSAGKATKNMSGEVSTAAKATKSLSGVVSAMTNPYVLLTAAIVGGTAALVTWALNNTDAARRARELEESQRRANEVLEQAKQATEDAADSYLQANDANETTLEGYQDLYDELMTLVDANGKVKEGYEDRVEYINGELNQAFGTELQLIDGAVQGVDKLAGSWDNLMQKQRAAMQLESMAEIYQAELQNQSNLKSEMDTEYEKIRELEQDIAERKVENEGALNPYDDELYRMEADLEEHQAIYSDLAAQLNASQSKTNLYEQAQVQQTAGDYQGVLTALGKIESTLTYTAEAGANLDQLKTQAEEANTALETTRARLEAVGQEGWQQSQEYQSALEAANGANREYLEGIVAKLKESGIQISDGMQESILQAQPDVQEAAVALLEAFSRATKEEKPGVLAQLYQLGIDVDSDLSNGLTSNLTAVVDSTTGMVTAIKDSADHQITNITPEFARCLVDMGVIGVEQMDSAVSSSRISAPGLSPLDAVTWASNETRSLQDELSKYTLTVRARMEAKLETAEWQRNARSAGGTMYSYYADGGLITQPHLGLVGEDGPEAIIPLSPSRRSRALDLWQQAGKWLGVKLHAAGAIVSRMQPVSYPPIVRNAEAQAQRMILQTRLNTDAIRQACKEGCESAVLAVAVENRVQAVFNPKTAAKEMADYTDAILGDKTRRVKRYAE